MTSPAAFVRDDGLQQLRDRERLQLDVGLDQDGAVRAHGERGAQRLLARGDAGGNRDHLGRLAGLP